MSPEELEERRLKAAAMFRRGMKQSAIAKRLGVSRTAVYYWHRTWKESGVRGLKKRACGPRTKLSAKDLAKLEAALLKGPEAYGYATNLWTLKRITALVKKVTGASYKERSIWFVLKRLGWTCQKPERRSKERNEKAIAHWRKVEWPAIQKKGFANG